MKQIPLSILALTGLVSLPVVAGAAHAHASSDTKTAMSVHTAPNGTKDCKELKHDFKDEERLLKDQQSVELDMCERANGKDSPRCQALKHQQKRALEALKDRAKTSVHEGKEAHKDDKHDQKTSDAKADKARDGVKSSKTQKASKS